MSSGRPLFQAAELPAERPAVLDAGHRTETYERGLPGGVLDRLAAARRSRAGSGRPAVDVETLLGGVTAEAPDDDDRLLPWGSDGSQGAEVPTPVAVADELNVE